ncbi:hypothetical protein B2G88_19005 [Natronolimnobius baerhuensis]|uniref:Uncharacterized protein n=1 Tax=Natronolimnobius baerhuensis TaxID=253108 RepID=A0A202E3V0_9EURY|nr:hypothetical protein B2G88_19005 [Natronolimnobius baerhuensis]
MTAERTGEPSDHDDHRDEVREERTDAPRNEPSDHAHEEHDDDDGHAHEDHVDHAGHEELFKRRFFVAVLSY